MCRVAAFGLCLLLYLSVLPSPLYAARFTGEYLLRVCGFDENGEELVEGGHIACQAYISGVLDYHNLIRSMGAAPSVDFCVPSEEGLTVLQGKLVDYLLKNREDHKQFIASPGVALAFFEYYPCGER